MEPTQPAKSVLLTANEARRFCQLSCAKRSRVGSLSCREVAPAAGTSQQVHNASAAGLCIVAMASRHSCQANRSQKTVKRVEVCSREARALAEPLHGCPAVAHAPPCPSSLPRGKLGIMVRTTHHLTAWAVVTDGSERQACTSPPSTPQHSQASRHRLGGTPGRAAGVCVQRASLVACAPQGYSGRLVPFRRKAQLAPQPTPLPYSFFLSETGRQGQSGRREVSNGQLAATIPGVSPH